MHLGIDVYNVIQSTLLALTKISRVQFAMASGILLGIILHSVIKPYLPNEIQITHLSGSESCPSLGLLFGLLALGQPDSDRCEE